MGGEVSCVCVHTTSQVFLLCVEGGVRLISGDRRVARERGLAREDPQIVSYQWCKRTMSNQY